MLLQNCDTVPIDTLGLLNDIMTFTDCDNFTEYMKSIYFAPKWISLRRYPLSRDTSTRRSWSIGLCTTPVNGKSTRRIPTPVFTSAILVNKVDSKVDKKGVTTMHIPEWDLVKDAAQVRDTDVDVVDPEVGAAGD